MASWQPKEFNINNINGGSRYEDGDGLGAETINAVVEASAFVQDVGRLGKNQPILDDDGGATSVSIDTTNNRFVFKNIKGQKGDKGDKGIQGDKGDKGVGIKECTLSSTIESLNPAINRINLQFNMDDGSTLPTVSFLVKDGINGNDIFTFGGIVSESPIISTNIMSATYYTINTGDLIETNIFEPKLYDHVIDRLGNVYTVTGWNDARTLTYLVYFSGICLKGDTGPQGERGTGVPDGGTAGQVLTKTADGTAWQDAQGGGGGSSPSLLYMNGINSYGAYNIYFKLPTAGVKRITILYTSQYNSSYYYNEYLNENVVIFDNGQPISGLEFQLLLDYSYDEYGNPLDRAFIPLHWRDNNTLDFDFYGSSNQSYVGYSGVSMTVLFKIEY